MTERCPECGRGFDPAKPWTVGPRESSRLDRRLILWSALAASGPLMSFVLLHVARTVAALQLGRWPRAMIDDPWLLGGPLRGFLAVVGFGCYLIPLSALGCLTLIGVAAVRGRYKAAWVMFLVGAGLWAGTFVVAFVDPGRAVEWYFD